MDLINIKNQIDKGISKLQYGNSPAELYDPIDYIMALGGKRMRPLLVVLGYTLFDHQYEKIINPAIAVELFHNFTLVHDDIMDKAPLRRGNVTVHQKWNENIAILSGDVMLVNTYNLLLEVEEKYLKNALKRFNRCAAEVCEGQQLDMNFENMDAIREEDYIEMIRRKTAVLLGFSLAFGGMMAGADENNIQLLNDFGESIGIGFQLKDDLLDVYGDAEKFGKQVGGDIIANKKTFLLIEALEKADDDTLKDLNYWLQIRDFDKQKKIKAITDIYNKLDIRKLTESKMNSFFEKGFEQLDKIQVEKEKKTFLLNFTKQLIERES